MCYQNDLQFKKLSSVELLKESDLRIKFPKRVCKMDQNGESINPRDFADGNFKKNYARNKN